MKIVAITRTFRGEEFCIESLKSIYDHVDKIVYVNSEISWSGDTGNTVKPIIDKFDDKDDKIVMIGYDTKNQLEQHAIAIKYIKKNFEQLDYVMLIDTDEVCDDTFWVAADKALKENESKINPSDCITCEWIAYIKSPFYRIMPRVGLYPVVFVRACAIDKIPLSIRGVGIENKSHINDAKLHHFTAVRSSLSECWKKINDSCVAEHVNNIEKESWVKNIWNKLPDASNIHYAHQYITAWKCVTEIGINELPVVCRDNKIVIAWNEYPKNHYRN